MQFEATTFDLLPSKIFFLPATLKSFNFFSRPEILPVNSPEGRAYFHPVLGVKIHSKYTRLKPNTLGLNCFIL